MRLLKFFEYIYLLIFVFSIYTAISEWNADEKKASIFMGFAILTLLIFFFRRYYRRRFEKQKQDNKTK